MSEIDGIPFGEVVSSIRIAMSRAGLKEAPAVFGGEQPFTAMHRGWGLEIGEVLDPGTYSDRSRAVLRYDLKITVTHRLRPTGRASWTDVEQAGRDYSRVISALMGSQQLNALGHLSLGRFSPKRTSEGEWVTAPMRFRLDVEIAWSLDGGEETGS